MRMQTDDAARLDLDDAQSKLPSVHPVDLVCEVLLRRLLGRDALVLFRSRCCPTAVPIPNAAASANTYADTFTSGRAM